jgi:hypothetical protein
MKILKLFIFAAITVVLLGFLKPGLHLLFRESFWLGAAGCLACLGIAVVFTALRGRAIAQVVPNHRGMRNQAKQALQIGRPFATSGPEIDKLVARFPGPITLSSSRLKWWLLVVPGAGMTAAAFLAGIVCLLGVRAGQDGAGIGVGISALGLVFFGMCTVLSVRMVRGGVLRLDPDGFAFSGFLRRQYRWSEVDDFSILRSKGNLVLFRTTQPNRNLWTRLNSVFAGGCDAWLPDTYGLRARELAQLMETWQSLAMVPSDHGVAPLLDPAIRKRDGQIPTEDLVKVAADA